MVNLISSVSCILEGIEIKFQNLMSGDYKYPSVKIRFVDKCNSDLKFRRSASKLKHQFCFQACKIASEPFNKALIKFDCGVTQFRTTFPNIACTSSKR